MTGILLVEDWPVVAGFFAAGHPLHRLRGRAPAGRIWLSGKILGPPGRLALCMVVKEHYVQHGKNGSWHEDWRRWSRLSKGL